MSTDEKKGIKAMIWSEIVQVKLGVNKGTSGKHVIVSIDFDMVVGD